MDITSLGSYVNKERVKKDLDDLVSHDTFAGSLQAVAKKSSAQVDLTLATVEGSFLVADGMDICEIPIGVVLKPDYPVSAPYCRIVVPEGYEITNNCAIVQPNGVFSTATVGSLSGWSTAPDSQRSLVLLLSDILNCCSENVPIKPTAGSADIDDLEQQLKDLEPLASDQPTPISEQTISQLEQQLQDLNDDPNSPQTDSVPDDLVTKTSQLEQQLRDLSTDSLASNTAHSTGAEPEPDAAPAVGAPNVISAPVPDVNTTSALETVPEVVPQGSEIPPSEVNTLPVSEINAAPVPETSTIAPGVVPEVVPQVVPEILPETNTIPVPEINAVPVPEAVPQGTVPEISAGPVPEANTIPEPEVVPEINTIPVQGINTGSVPEIIPEDSAIPVPEVSTGPAPEVNTTPAPEAVPEVTTAPLPEVTTAPLPQVPVSAIEVTDAVAAVSAVPPADVDTDPMAQLHDLDTIDAKDLTLPEHQIQDGGIPTDGPQPSPSAAIDILSQQIADLNVTPSSGSHPVDQFADLETIAAQHVASECVPPTDGGQHRDLDQPQTAVVDPFATPPHQSGTMMREQHSDPVADISSGSEAVFTSAFTQPVQSVDVPSPRSLSTVSPVGGASKVFLPVVDSNSGVTTTSVPSPTLSPLGGSNVGTPVPAANSPVPDQLQALFSPEAKGNTDTTQQPQPQQQFSDLYPHSPNDGTDDDKERQELLAVLLPKMTANLTDAETASNDRLREWEESKKEIVREETAMFKEKYAAFVQAVPGVDDAIKDAKLAEERAENFIKASGDVYMDLIQPDCHLGQQCLEYWALDNAIEDALRALDQGLNTGAINSSQFHRAILDTARKQFEARSVQNKITKIYSSQANFSENKPGALTALLTEEPSKPRSASTVRSAEDDINLLLEGFPQFDPVIVVDVYYNTGQSMERAMSRLQELK